jgi:hypothetical protein
MLRRDDNAGLKSINAGEVRAAAQQIGAVAIRGNAGGIKLTREIREGFRGYRFSSPDNDWGE